MSDFGKWVDAHAHLADPRWSNEEIAPLVEKAKALGIGFIMQGGVSPEDWSRQMELLTFYPESLGLCFGLHPYFVAQFDEEVCEIALDGLARLLPSAMGLGETGLDFRPHIMKDSQDRQLGVFEKHLELAEVSHKPLVLHLVQAHKEALRVFDIWGVPPAGGMVHSFNGSASQANDFLSRGLYLSVGGPVCRLDNKKLHQAVKEIPIERLLIESDSPDQPGPAFLGQKNPPASVLQVAEMIGQIKGASAYQILDATSGNFWRLFARPSIV